MPCMALHLDGPPAPVTRAPALIRDQVATYLRGQITSMRLAPGTVLIEREICEATTASRATVREALRQLESDGLVSSEPGKGTVVASLSKQEAIDIYDIRAQLEGLACRLFVKNATAADIDVLITTVDRLGSTIDDPAAMLQAKADFYDALFTGAGNFELPRILEGLRRRITLLRVSSLSAPGRPPESLKEIQAIRDALVNRDGPRAEELCRQHIDAAATAILSAPGAQFRDS